MPSMLTRLYRELRRRRVFRLAGLYVIGAWVVMQVADVFFPAWGISDAAKQVLVLAALAGFPIALAFGWFFDIGPDGIRRTRPIRGEGELQAVGLGRSDYLILTGFVLVAGLLIYNAISGVLQAPSAETEAANSDPDAVGIEKLARSIAVLPFANMSSDPDNAHFADGLADEILHRLAEVRELHVIGRTSSFAFKDSNYRIPRISSLLGVRYLLQGSVRKHGNQLRISAQLVDATGEQQWSAVFDRTLDDVFVIQEEIARVVAETIAPQVAVEAEIDYEPDLEAYQHYLLGREHIHYRNVPEARAELAQAIEIDPGFADAHAEYAVAMTLFTSNPEDLLEARQAIELALQLQPGHPRALAARGLRMATSQDEAAEAERILRQVLERDPSMVDAFNWLAVALTHQGKNSEAVSVQERGFRVDPMNPTIGANLAATYQAAGEFDRAERILLRLDELPDTHFYVVEGLARLYWSTGRLVEMDRYVQRFLNDEDFPNLPGFRAYRYLHYAKSRALLGLWNQARTWAEAALRPAPDPGSMAVDSWLRLHYEPLRWQGRYRAAVDALQEVVSTFGPISDAPATITLDLGVLLSLAGDHEGALQVLEPLVPGLINDPQSDDAIHALAWSFDRSGESERADELLKSAARLKSTGALSEQRENSEALFFWARHALLAGDREQALALLRRAVEAGWSEYYLQRNDPRWSDLADDPRYRALMQAVKDAVDTQRSEVTDIATAGFGVFVSRRIGKKLIHTGA